jgi:hypothetical protein
VEHGRRGRHQPTHLIIGVIRGGSFTMACKQTPHEQPTTRSIMIGVSRESGIRIRGCEWGIAHRGCVHEPPRMTPVKSWPRSDPDWSGDWQGMDASRRREKHGGWLVPPEIGRCGSPRSQHIEIYGLEGHISIGTLQVFRLIAGCGFSSLLFHHRNTCQSSEKYLPIHLLDMVRPVGPGLNTHDIAR